MSLFSSESEHSLPTNVARFKICKIDLCNRTKAFGNALLTNRSPLAHTVAWSAQFDLHATAVIEAAGERLAVDPAPPVLGRCACLVDTLLAHKASAVVNLLKFALPSSITSIGSAFVVSASAAAVGAASASSPSKKLYKVKFQFPDGPGVVAHAPILPFTTSVNNANMAIGNKHSNSFNRFSFSDSLCCVE
jgi:hypothetical protein